MGEGPGDKPAGKTKKKKAKPPDLPKGAPKELVDFVDCKADSYTIAPGKIGWLPKEGIGEYLPDPEVSFAEDPNKKGTFNVSVTLGKKFTFPGTIKDGKLEVDSSTAPLDKIKQGIDNWVKNLNDWLEAKGRKLEGATIKDGKLTVTKAAVAPPAKGVKQGAFLPNVPMGEKVVGAGVLALATVFGIGFVNAGDETTATTTTSEVVAAPDDVGAPPVVEGIADQVQTVDIAIDGGASGAGVVEPPVDGVIAFQVPFFAIGEPHEITFRDAQGNTVDRATFVVPAAEGPASKIRTGGGGIVVFDVIHDPMLGGPSGGDGTYSEPVPDPTASDADEGPTGEAIETVDTTTTETTEGKPWSLLAIPGSLALVGGAGYARNTCRGDKKREGYGPA